jgi:putative FmdB family regulatory protein
MPLYDYQCRVCGQVFEVRATFKEKEQGLRPPCPACKHAETEQVVRAPMFVRAGAGAASAPLACGPSAGPGCC